MYYFADIDECEDAIDSCSVKAECTNAVGSYNCACLPGFSGDGTICSGIHSNVLKGYLFKRSFFAL